MPAPNVTQGGQPKEKGKTAFEYEGFKDPKDKAIGLPQDKCFPDGCGTDPQNVNNNPRIGNGNWDYQNYFRINHPCDPALKACAGPPEWKPADWPGGSANWPPTRYETYRYETEAPSIVTPNKPIYGGAPNVKTAEYGGPQCYTGSPVPEIPGYYYFPEEERNKALLGDRRVISIAVVNCIARKKAGLKVSGRFSFTPAELAFVFITEPVPPPNKGKIDLFVEALGRLDESAMDYLVKDIVQIYRRRGR